MQDVTKGGSGRTVGAVESGRRRLSSVWLSKLMGRMFAVVSSRSAGWDVRLGEMADSDGLFSASAALALPPQARAPATRNNSFHCQQQKTTRIIILRKEEPNVSSSVGSKFEDPVEKDKQCLSDNGGGPVVKHGRRGVSLQLLHGAVGAAALLE